MLSNAEVFVRKNNGTQIGPFRGTLSAKSFIVMDKKFEVEEGEHIVRVLPNGREETYLVRTAQFYDGHGGIPPNWQLEIQKTTAILSPSSTPATTVNIHNSTGIQVGNQNLMSLQTAVNEITKRIDESNASAEDKAEAKSRLQSFLDHPLVGSIVGGIVGAIV